MFHFGLGFWEMGLLHHKCSWTAINYTTVLFLISLAAEIILIRTMDEKCLTVFCTDAVSSVEKATQPFLDITEN